MGGNASCSAVRSATDDMTEEEVVASPDPTSTAVAADSHKRKLEDLEVKNGPALLAESEANVENGGGDDSDNKLLRLDTEGEDHGGRVETEDKRPRLETNGETIGGPRLVSLEKIEVEETESEPKEEQLPNKHNPANEDGQTVEGLEPAETTASLVPASSEYGRTEIESTDQLEQPGAEVEEPSKELSQEVNIPVASAEVEENSDTQIITHKMEVPNDKVGVLIGKAGDTIRSLQDTSGAKIKNILELVGTMESVRRAEKLIKDVIAKADAGGFPSLVARGFNIVQAASGGEQVEMPVPADRVCLIIGKGGETIRNMQTKSGAQIQLIPRNLGDLSMKMVVRVSGSKKQIEIATEMIKDVMNQADAGGFPSLVARGFNTVRAASGGEQVEIPVPVDRVCLFMGKGGETIRNMQTKSGAQIQLMPQNLRDLSMKMVVRVSGSKKQIEIATEMIKDVMNQADAGGSPSLVAHGFNTLQAASGGEQVEIPVPVDRVKQIEIASQIIKDVKNQFHGVQHMPHALTLQQRAAAAMLLQQQQQHRASRFSTQPWPLQTWPRTSGPSGLLNLSRTSQSSTPGETTWHAGLERRTVDKGKGVALN